MDLEDILMKISILCGLLLCLLVILIGIAAWFVSDSFITKLMVSTLCIMFGTGFGSIGIGLWNC